MIDGRSDAGSGFFAPKKAVGLVARGEGLLFTLAFGLEAALGWPFGMKELAAGFGTNSWALTLNFPDVADVGVRKVLDPCEPLSLGAFVPGRLGGFPE